LQQSFISIQTKISIQNLLPNITKTLIQNTLLNIPAAIQSKIPILGRNMNEEKC